MFSMVLLLLNIFQGIVIWDLRKDRKEEDDEFTISKDTEQVGDYPIITEEERENGKKN